VKKNVFGYYYTYILLWMAVDNDFSE